MKFLTKKEVAEVLRVSVRTITEYNSKGLLPRPKRLGRTLLWEESELFAKVSCTGMHRKDTEALPVRASRGRPRKVKM